MARILDAVFFFYFLTHIPIAIFMDFQAILPFYPKQLEDFRLWYCNKFKDAMMLDPQPWFQSFTTCELIFQLPFFFVATYGYYKGANKCKWLRLPAIIYGVHVATTLIPILAHILFHDFTQDKNSFGPKTPKDRLTLISVYMPYFIIPIAIFLDGLFSSAYQGGRNKGGNATNNAPKLKTKPKKKAS